MTKPAMMVTTTMTATMMKAMMTLLTFRKHSMSLYPYRSATMRKIIMMLVVMMVMTSCLVPTATVIFICGLEEELCILLPKTTANVSINLSVCLPVCLSVYLSMKIYLSIYLSVSSCISIYILLCLQHKAAVRTHAHARTQVALTLTKPAILDMHLTCDRRRQTGLMVIMTTSCGLWPVVRHVR